MIHGILSVQFTCLTVFFHNLSTSSPQSEGEGAVLWLNVDAPLKPMGNLLCSCARVMCSSQITLGGLVLVL